MVVVVVDGIVAVEMAVTSMVPRVVVLVVVSVTVSGIVLVVRE